MKTLKGKINQYSQILQFIWLYRALSFPIIAKDIAKTVWWILLFILIGYFILILSGCASMSTTTTFPDGRQTSTHAFVIGRTETMTDFRDNMTKDGRDVSVGSAKGDVNVEALKQSNDLLGKLVEGMMKGFVEGAK